MSEHPSGSDKTGSLEFSPSKLDPRFLSEHFRQNMPVAAQWGYFDHAAVGPLSGPARTALQTFVDQGTRDGDLHWPEWAKGLSGARRAVAAGIGASPSEIAFVANTTEGINLVADGLNWRDGDNLVVPAGEFPSNHYAWRQLSDRGVELRVVPTGAMGEFDPADVAARCDSLTRLIVTSWVGFASGFRVDLDALAQVANDIGCQLFVDAIQGLGVFPLDVSRTPIDYLAADGHKWLLSPEGFGVAYVREEHITRLRPSHLGWNSVVNPFDYQDLTQPLRTDAQRFEGGSHNLLAAQALRASVDLLSSSGWGKDSVALADNVLRITDELVERLRRRGATIHSDRRPRHASGIVSFSFDGHDPVALRKSLIERSVVLSCRAGRLRAALHGYNTVEDLDRLDAALGELL